MALFAGRPQALDTAGVVLGILCPRQICRLRIGDAAHARPAIHLILQKNRAALAEDIGFAEAIGWNIPWLGPPICGLSRGDRQQGPEHHRTRFFAAVANRADAQRRRADSR